MNCKRGWRSRGRKALVAACVVFIASLVACERDMTIAVVNQSNPPSFKLSGSGRLVFSPCLKCHATDRHQLTTRKCGRFGQLTKI
jgi:hypothetical protein